MLKFPIRTNNDRLKIILGFLYFDTYFIYRLLRLKIEKYENIFNETLTSNFHNNYFPNHKLLSSDKMNNSKCFYHKGQIKNIFC